MKTLAIATLVGTIILFLYLTIVHALLTSMIHESDFKYTPSQNDILGSLSSYNLDDGAYMLPYSPPGTSMEEHEKLMKEAIDKPWAVLIYHNKMDFNYSVLIMSFIYNLISVLIICIALAAASTRLSSFGQRLWFVMLFALFVIFSNIMMGYNWIELPMHFLKGQIINVVGGFFFVGLWLAWYYGRLATRAVAN